MRYTGMPPTHRMLLLGSWESLSGTDKWTLERIYCLLFSEMVEMVGGHSDILQVLLLLVVRSVNAPLDFLLILWVTTPHLFYFSHLSLWSNSCGQHEKLCRITTTAGSRDKDIYLGGRDKWAEVIGHYKKRFLRVKWAFHIIVLGCCWP